MKLRGHLWWRALDNIIDRNGVFIVTAIRFCPLIPFAVLNLFLGASPLSPIVFLISLTGSVPFCIFVVFFGARGKYAIADFWAYPLARRILLANLMITVILSIVIGAMMRTELKKIDKDMVEENQDINIIDEPADAITVEQGPVQMDSEVMDTIAS